MYHKYICLCLAAGRIVKVTLWQDTTYLLLNFRIFSNSIAWKDELDWDFSILNLKFIPYSWIPTCAKIFLDKNELWQHLVPPGADDSTELVEQFFACVAALMSIQLRSMIVNSLSDFLGFFENHKQGNDFGEEFDELQYVQTQVMIIKLRVEEPKIIFDPPFREIRDIILRCFSEVIASGEGLTRVRFMSVDMAWRFCPLHVND